LQKFDKLITPTERGSRICAEIVKTCVEKGKTGV